MSHQDEQLFPDAGFSFGPRFLHDHAGHIITDPRIAVVELVANSYDAGASIVEIRWPELAGAQFEVSDNGTGMTPEDFNKRWRTLSYSRSKEQGTRVEYPPGASGPSRIAFGQNGKGRYGPLCFGDEYEVETWRDGICIRVRVGLTQGGEEPFHLELLSQSAKDGHGTSVRAVPPTQSPSSSSCRGSDWARKFLVDPYFSIAVNGTKLELPSLSGLTSSDIPVDSFGTVVVHQIDALVQDRTTLLRGITWWVNGRMVGSPSWDGLDGQGAILDGRTGLAKRLSFVVEADFLKDDVKSDWTGLHDTRRTLATRQVVRDFVTNALTRALSDTRRERKREALAQTREVIARLPRLSKRLVGEFIDEVQLNCPSLSHGDLVRTASIFAKLEDARSGYELLEKLDACSPEDLDTWNGLMEQWSASSAEIVLSELKRRLDLIERLQQLANAATTNELHELHPLFARGLWMFGPEYESVEFTSNRAMTTVVCAYLGGSDDRISSRRPDILALPNPSIACYSADSFDEAGEVNGVRKILIVELKKGGFRITTTELRQGEDYALELQKANLVSKETDVVVYVLGASLADEATEERRVGGWARVLPMTYDTLLNRAHARTFNLLRKLQAQEQLLPQDEDIEELLRMPLFDDQECVTAEALIPYGK